MTLRVVFACVVFLQGAARPLGPARACLALLDQGSVTLCLSVPIVAEIVDVLSRPKIRRRFPLLTDERVEMFLQDLQAKATFFEDIPVAFTYPRDPDDEGYVNLAVAAGARYLVTWDNDLLDLMKDESFRQKFPELTILNPVSFLQSGAPKTPAE